MSEAPQRRWHQLHLSTLVALSFVAGGLVWLNIPFTSKFNNEILPRRVQGWPKVFEIHANDDAVLAAARQGYLYYGDFFSWQLLAMDLIVAVSILVAVAWLLEWRARRES